MKKILVLLYPGCISFEIALACEILSRNFQIVTATPQGEDLYGSGLPLKSMYGYQQVSLHNVAGILVPGGDPRILIENTEVDRILREANQIHLPIGAICAGPSVLAKAGILKGKTIAHGYQKGQLEYLAGIFAGVRLSEEAFVRDGNILTAKPDAYVEFAEQFAALVTPLVARDRGSQSAFAEA